MLDHPIEIEKSATRHSCCGACGQVAQLVEQRIENPRVGGSTPPLATFSILFLLAAGCKPDPCEQLCQRTTNRLAVCMQDWPVDWDDFDSTSRANFRTRCDNRWDEVRSSLEPRELEDARDQCSETLSEIAELRQNGEDCDHLRALYIE